ncbi:MAG: hypothetical protein QM765_30600 [Myxococcales bacterium]
MLAEGAIKMGESQRCLATSAPTTATPSPTAASTSARFDGNATSCAT